MQCLVSWKGFYSTDTQAVVYMELYLVGAEDGCPVDGRFEGRIVIGAEDG